MPIIHMPAKIIRDSIMAYATATPMPRITTNIKMKMSCSSSLQYPPVDLVDIVVADFCPSSLPHLDSSGFEHLAFGRNAFQQIVPGLDERFRAFDLELCAQGVYVNAGLGEVGQHLVAVVVTRGTMFGRSPHGRRKLSKSLRASCSR